jgi:seryl-tRNA synthetase
MTIDRGAAHDGAAQARQRRLEELTAALFRPLGVDGVYARTEIYEDLIARLSDLITSIREAETEVLRFPPVMSRSQLEKSGYLKSFPNLLGCVCALHGTETEIRTAASRYETGGEWTSSLTAADLVLSPAACYPVYPIVARQGPIGVAGRLFDVSCDCFRHEPSRQLDRLQSFRMREYVCIGSPDAVNRFGERWIPKAKQLADSLGLTYEIAPASDPFFGRVGQVMAVSQLQQSLKFELLVPLPSESRLTACMSFNYHRDHFGEIWDLRLSDGHVAHTGCVAFGMDRLAIGLFWTHGVNLKEWPDAVRHVLSI